MRRMIVMTLLAGCLLLTGCDSSGESANVNFLDLYDSANDSATNTCTCMEFIRYCDDEHDIAEYRDTETGVHWFLYSHCTGSGGAGGLVPRYNADGTLYVD